MTVDEIDEYFKANIRNNQETDIGKEVSNLSLLREFIFQNQMERKDH